MGLLHMPAGCFIICASATRRKGGVSFHVGVLPFTIFSQIQGPD
jgi:hypothetical protein